MIAKIQRDGCISCGLCANVCPDVFRMADDGLAQVHQTPVPPASEADAAHARDGCPVSVITLE